MSAVEPKRAVMPTMWRTGDLVIIKIKDGSERPGLILEETRQCHMYDRPSWMYRVLIDSSVSLIFESGTGYNRIIRRVTETSEDFWSKLTDD